MSEMLRYVETHPWWTLIYLIVTVNGLAGLLLALRGKCK